MPSRRTVLAGLAATVTATTTGCLSSLSGGRIPAYADWLHDPTAIVPANHYGVTSVDVATLWSSREQLPESVRDRLDALERFSTEVSLSSFDRLTTLAYGDPRTGELGTTLLATGTFDPPTVRRSIGVRESHLVTDEGTAGAFNLYGYAPAVFTELQRYRGPEQSRAPDLSFGLGVTEHRLVGGAVLSASATGLDAVHAAIDTHDAGAGLTDDRMVTDLLATVGDRTLSGVVPARTASELAVDAEASVRELLADAEGVGVGYDLETERLRMALTGNPSELADPERVRSALEDSGTTDGSIERVGLARSGRVVYAEQSIPLETAVSTAENVSRDTSFLENETV